MDQPGPYYDGEKGVEVKVEYEGEARDATVVKINRLKTNRRGTAKRQKFDGPNVRVSIDFQKDGIWDQDVEEEHLTLLDGRRFEAKNYARAQPAARRRKESKRLLADSEWQSGAGAGLDRRGKQKPPPAAKESKRERLSLEVAVDLVIYYFDGGSRATSQRGWYIAKDKDETGISRLVQDRDDYFYWGPGAEAPEDVKQWRQGDQVRKGVRLVYRSSNALTLTKVNEPHPIIFRLSPGHMQDGKPVYRALMGNSQRTPKRARPAPPAAPPPIAALPPPVALPPPSVAAPPPPAAPAAPPARAAPEVIMIVDSDDEDPPPPPVVPAHAAAAVADVTELRRVVSDLHARDALKHGPLYFGVTKIGGAKASDATRAHEDAVRTILSFYRKYRPAGEKPGAGNITSVYLSTKHDGKCHTDDGNVGLNSIIALDLYGRAPFRDSELELGIGPAAVPVDIRPSARGDGDPLFDFDATLPHRPRPWTGTRIVVAFYRHNPVALRGLSPGDCAYLVALGFPLPPSEAERRAYDELINAKHRAGDRAATEAAEKRRAADALQAEAEALAARASADRAA